MIDNYGMKRFAVNLGVTFLIFVLLLTSCGKSAPEENRRITGATVKWTQNGDEYGGAVSLGGNQPADTALYRDASMRVTSPEQIAGLTVAYAGDSATASVGEVAFELPDGTGEELYRIIRSLSVGEGTLTESTCGEETAYTVTYENGVPSTATISWDGGDMTVRFTDVVLE